MPGLLALIDGALPSGRYRAQEVDAPDQSLTVPDLADSEVPA